MSSAHTLVLITYAHSQILRMRAILSFFLHVMAKFPKHPRKSENPTSAALILSSKLNASFLAHGFPL